MARFTILGAGMVGAAMAHDLSQDDHEVTVADQRQDTLADLSQRYGVQTATVDVRDPASLANVIDHADVVLGALSSVIGLATMKSVIEIGKPYVDISFMAEDARVLDSLAKERGVPVVYDCGVCPWHEQPVGGTRGSAARSMPNHHDLCGRPSG